VVYVDNDPIVMLHARTLLTSTGPGKTSYIEADLREPQKILSQAAGLLDFTQPVAVMLLGVLHFIKDEDDPHRIVKTIMDAVPSGSYLVITHLAGDVYPEVAETSRRYNERADDKSVPRDRAECTRFFDGLELAEPGVVPWSKWRPRTELEGAAHAIGWSGVARKP
jgi:O-methyltransferase involved in polyketide biosynthesis